MFRRLFIVLIILGLFVFALYDSGAIKTVKEIRMRAGKEYVVFKRDVNWDRFLRYLTGKKDMFFTYVSGAAGRIFHGPR